MTGVFETAVGRALGATVVGSQRIHGGDFAAAFQMKLDTGRAVFAKTHSNPPPGFFTTEATGLSWLRSSGTVRVPEVLAVSDDPALLVLEWIETAPGARPDEESLGHSLADLHLGGPESFGRADLRTTGSLGLPNRPCATWSEFFATQRLLPLAAIAGDRKTLSERTVQDLETLASRLPDLVAPEEAPSLLHGDLWAGNRLVDRDGHSWLIDPACFGGHREFDLAMMALFGGFGSAVFDAYDEAYPLAHGWRERIELHQIAPLVVHAIKFGGGYVSSATAAINRYL